MYTHIRLINHSLNYMKYMRGETSYKEHPEKIAEIDMPSSGGIRYTMNRYLEMRLDCKYGNPSLIGSTVQVTLSPIKEDTLGYNGDDWKKLWVTYLEEMDKIDTVRIKDNKEQWVDQKVEKTRFTESNQLVCLHMEAKSRIPHIHGAICPVDKNGRTYGLDFLIERSRMAARLASQRLGLTDSSNDSVNNLSRAYHTCLDVILNMTQAWSWEQFKKGVMERGYNLREKKDKYGKVQQWAMSKGDKTFRERDMSESFRFENIYHLWHELIEPYNNPLDILSSEEILDEIRMRGWYDRFLRSEFHNQMETALYDLLEQKLVREQELLDYEELIYGDKNYLDSIEVDVDVDENEEAGYLENREFSAETLRHRDFLSKDELSRNVLYKYYDSIGEGTPLPMDDESDDSFATYDDYEDDYTLNPSSSKETEELTAQPPTSKAVNAKKKQLKPSLKGESLHAEQNTTSQEVNHLNDNQPSRESSCDLRI